MAKSAAWCHAAPRGQPSRRRTMKCCRYHQEEDKWSPAAMSPRTPAVSPAAVSRIVKRTRGPLQRNLGTHRNPGQEPQLRGALPRPRHKPPAYVIGLLAAKGAGIDLNRLSRSCRSWRLRPPFADNPPRAEGAGVFAARIVVSNRLLIRT